MHHHDLGPKTPVPLWKPLFLLWVFPVPERRSREATGPEKPMASPCDLGNATDALHRANPRPLPRMSATRLEAPPAHRTPPASGPSSTAPPSADHALPLEPRPRRSPQPRPGPRAPHLRTMSATPPCASCASCPWLRSQRFRREAAARSPTCASRKGPLRLR